MNLELGIALFALSLSAVLIAFFVVILIFLIRGFLSFRGTSFTELLKFIKHKLKEDIDEVIIEKPISRERQRELLMEYCRDISVTSVHDVEHKFNIMCIQILEDNPEICTIEELIIELDKIDKNLFKGELK